MKLTSIFSAWATRKWTTENPNGLKSDFTVWYTINKNKNEVKTAWQAWKVHTFSLLLRILFMPVLIDRTLVKLHHVDQEGMATDVMATGKFGIPKIESRSPL
jgi:hypothetical protein